MLFHRVDMMKILFFLIVFLISPISSSAEPPQNMTKREHDRTLFVLNEPIIMFEATLGSLTPEDRVRRAQEKINNLNSNDFIYPIKIEAKYRFGESVRVISINNIKLITILAGDLNEDDAETLDKTASIVGERLEKARMDFLKLRSPTYMIRSLLFSMLIVMLFFGILSILRFIQKKMQKSLVVGILSRRGWLSDGLRPFIGRVEVKFIKFIFNVIYISCGYVLIALLFSLFPQTRGWSRRLSESLFSVMQEILSGIFDALPDIGALILIFYLTHLFNKMLNVFFSRVETGYIKINGLHRETIGATRRLTNFLIWLFSFTLAYPYLPGAHSDAFKGVSVFFGLMVTFGSAGVMNHAMSGLVIIYSRALRIGEWVKIGDIEGAVTEINALSTKIMTREAHEVTLPNAVVVGGKVTNLSRLSGGNGLPLQTTVTIGYDTPWRQVHAMLKVAAQRTMGVNHVVAPKVRQLALLDWYVEYELLVNIIPGEKLIDIRSKLNAMIQDVFNEFGVQIMSPNFVYQPDSPVIVTQENMFAPPADREL